MKNVGARGRGRVYRRNGPGTQVKSCSKQKLAGSGAFRPLGKLSSAQSKTSVCTELTPNLYASLSDWCLLCSKLSHVSVWGKCEPIPDSDIPCRDSARKWEAMEKT